jgi:molybdate transport system permease protein
MDINSAFSPLCLSLQLAFFTTVMLILLAAPLAYVLVHARFPGKTFFEALLNLPMALPPTVLGFYLLVLMGPEGAAGQAWNAVLGAPLLFTFTGIAIASMIYSLPFALQPMKTAFQKIDRRLLESSYILGLTPAAAFLRVVLPNSVSGIATSAILIFVHSLGAFGVLLMVGGSIPGETRVASIAIYEAVQSMDYAEAGRMSLILLAIGYIFMLIVNRLGRN